MGIGLVVLRLEPLWCSWTCLVEKYYGTFERCQTLVF